MSRPRLLKLIITSLLIGLPLAGAVYAWHLLSSPSKGTVSRGTVSDKISTDADQATVILKGKLISFERKKAYRLHAPARPDPKSLEQHYLITGLPYSKTLVVAVEKLPPEGLEGHSGYKLRQSLADQYKEEIKTPLQQSARIMTKHDKLEQMAFITKGSMVATIGLTTTSTQDDLSAEMSKILTSFKWK
jgi:hypothetical protein